MLIEEIAQHILVLVTIHLDNHREIVLMQAEQRGLRANKQMESLLSDLPDSDFVPLHPNNSCRSKKASFLSDGCF